MEGSYGSPIWQGASLRLQHFIRLDHLRQRLYEHKTDRPIPIAAFINRLGTHVGIAAAIIFGSLGIGVIGYRALEGFSWIDSLLNASMILGGMVPVDQLQTQAGKIFASFYAFYSGIAFLVFSNIQMT
jgi:hypothetical protein